LVFYAWWRPVNLLILLLSVCVNFLLGRIIRNRLLANLSMTKPLLAGILFNVLLLGFFKYTNFFIENLNFVFHQDIPGRSIVLPLAISFFTFTQIAYLIDCSQDRCAGYNFLDYVLFVSTFPHLIAGPIVHHRQLISQFSNQDSFRFRPRSFALGCTIFLVGLFKKAVLADHLALFANTVFSLASHRFPLTAGEAWTGPLTYTLQLYFDFSGYSDMAIGSALLFNLVLPLNFNSPFRAVNVIDFWNRWHMTLTRFLTDYVYNPIVLSITRRRLAAGKKLMSRTSLDIEPFMVLVAFPMLVTMFVSGVWHGAGWQFIIFGMLHGSYLVINHAWHQVQRRMGQDPSQSSKAGRQVARLATLMAVMIAMVFFRAPDVKTAWFLIRSMFGSHGLSLPHGMAAHAAFLKALGIQFRGFVTPESGLNTNEVLPWTISLFAIAWFVPNLYYWIQDHTTDFQLPSGDVFASWWKAFRWQPSIPWAVSTAVLGVVAVLSMLSGVREFLYFQF